MLAYFKETKNYIII